MSCASQCRARCPPPPSIRPRGAFPGVAIEMIVHALGMRRLAASAPARALPEGKNDAGPVLADGNNYRRRAPASAFDPRILVQDRALFAPDLLARVLRLTAASKYASTRMDGSANSLRATWGTRPEDGDMARCRGRAS